MVLFQSNRMASKILKEFSGDTKGFGGINGNILFFSPYLENGFFTLGFASSIQDRAMDR